VVPRGSELREPVPSLSEGEERRKKGRPLSEEFLLPEARFGAGF
jgi:hypothetical protein